MSASGDIRPAAPSRLTRLLGSTAAKFSLDVLYAAISQALGRGSLILASILVANFMTTESFAAFTYFNLTVSAIAAFSTLGLGTAAARIFAEGNIDLDDAAKERMRTVLFVTAIAALLAALAVLVAPANLLSSAVQVDRPLLACAIALVTFNSVALGALSGRGSFDILALAAVLSTVVLLSGVAGAVVVESTSLAVLAIVLSMAAQFAVYLIVLRPVLSGGASGLPSASECAATLQIAGPMFVTSLLVGGMFWVLGRIVLGAPGGVTEFSRYAVGLQWFSLTLLLPSIVTRVFFPRIVRAASEGEQQGRGIVFANAGANLLIAAAIGAILLLAGDLLLALYGNTDLADTSAFRWFIAAAVIASPVNGLGNAIIARDPGPRHWLSLKTVWALIALFALMHWGAGAENAGAALFTAYLCLVPASLAVPRWQKLI